MISVNIGLFSTESARLKAQLFYGGIEYDHANHHSC